MSAADPPARLVVRHLLLGVHGIAVICLTVVTGCHGYLIAVGDNFYATARISLAGTGTGKVKSSFPPPFDTLDCGLGATVCEITGDLDQFGSGGVAIDVTSSPGPGSTFAGWSGACTRDSRPSLGPTKGTFAMAEEGTYECVATFNLVAPVACANPITIQDDFATDAGAGWTVGASMTNTAFTHTSSYEATGGNAGGGGPNSGGYRRMVHALNGIGSMAVYHLWEEEYDPSGANEIHHINYSEDFVEFDPPFAGAAVGWGFFLEQDGIRYSKIIGSGVFTTLTWQSGGIANLTSADFPGAKFGTGGGKIKFGFFRSNTNDGVAPVTVRHGIDNWKVEICR